MGEPKWRVEIGGLSFLQHIIKAFRQADIEKIFAVFRERETIPTVDIIPLINPRPEKGQLSSLKIALQALDPGIPFIMHLIDRPLVKPDTFRSLIEGCGGNRIAIPVFGGRRGHPVFFPPGMREVLMTTNNDAGIRGGIQAWKPGVIMIEVPDEGILWNIDTREELNRLKELLRIDRTIHQ